MSQGDANTKCFSRIVFASDDIFYPQRKELPERCQGHSRPRHRTKRFYPLSSPGISIPLSFSPNHDLICSALNVVKLASMTSTIHVHLFERTVPTEPRWTSLASTTPMPREREVLCSCTGEARAKCRIGRLDRKKKPCRKHSGAKVARLGVAFARQWPGDGELLFSETIKKYRQRKERDQKRLCGLCGSKRQAKRGGAGRRVEISVLTLNEEPEKESKNKLTGHESLLQRPNGFSRQVADFDCCGGALNQFFLFFFFCCLARSGARGCACCGHHFFLSCVDVS